MSVPTLRGNIVKPACTLPSEEELVVYFNVLKVTVTLSFQCVEGHRDLVLSSVDIKISELLFNRCFISVPNKKNSCETFVCLSSGQGLVSKFQSVEGHCDQLISEIIRIVYII